jgi:hypothetical protein
MGLHWPAVNPGFLHCSNERLLHGSATQEGAGVIARSPSLTTLRRDEPSEEGQKAAEPATSTNRTLASCILRGGLAGSCGLAADEPAARPPKPVAATSAATPEGCPGRAGPTWTRPSTGSTTRSSTAAAAAAAAASSLTLLISFIFDLFTEEIKGCSRSSSSSRGGTGGQFFSALVLRLLEARP